VGGHLYEIRRIECEPYHVQQALPLEKLLSLSREELESQIIPVEQCLSHLPRVEIPDELEEKLKNGQPLPLKLLLAQLPSHLSRGAVVQLSGSRWLGIIRLNYSVSELFQAPEKVTPFRYERVILK
jgi:tRNA U55 pseudouridine synthase TruB